MLNAFTRKYEARQFYNRCHNCRLWVCDTDFNEEEGLCVECAPRDIQEDNGKQ
ncbi:MAG: hypothetical protein ACYDEX_12600 [Mobilitalea sp.]